MCLGVCVWRWADFDAQTKGLAIGNSEVLRREHNSFHKVSSFEFVQDKDDEKEDAFHFISYVPFKGKIYELDGLKPVTHTHTHTHTQTRPDQTRRDETT